MKCFSVTHIEWRFVSSLHDSRAYCGAVRGAEIFPPVPQFWLDNPPTPSWHQLCRKHSKVGEPVLLYHLACSLLWRKRKAHLDSNVPTFARPWRWCAASVHRPANVGGHLICVIAFKSTLASSLNEEKYNAWICRQQAFCWSNKIRELLAQHQKWHHLIGEDASSLRAVK